MLPASPGFNELGISEDTPGNSSVLGGCKEREGHGQSRNTERERGLQLSVGSLAHRQPLCCSPEVWNRQGPGVSSGCDLLGHRAPALLLQPWHHTGIPSVGGSSWGKEPSEPQLSWPGPCPQPPALGHEHRERASAPITWKRLWERGMVRPVHGAAQSQGH